MFHVEMEFSPVYKDKSDIYASQQFHLSFPFLKDLIPLEMWHFKKELLNQNYLKHNLLNSCHFQ